MTRRGLRIALAGLVVTAGLVGWWLLRSHSATSPGKPVAGSDTHSMAGMPGMAAMSQTGTVSLSADQIRSFGVTFGTVELRELEPTIRGTAVVALDETRVA